MVARALLQHTRYNRSSSKVRHNLEFGLLGVLITLIQSTELASVKTVSCQMLAPSLSKFGVVLPPRHKKSDTRRYLRGFNGVVCMGIWNPHWRFALRCAITSVYH